MGSRTLWSTKGIQQFPNHHHESSWLQYMYFASEFKSIVPILFLLSFLPATENMGEKHDSLPTSAELESSEPTTGSVMATTLGLRYDDPIDEVAEKKPVRKLDLWIIPPVTLLYLLRFLGRVNIGNARLYGLEDDLGLVGNQYQLAVSISSSAIPYLKFHPTLF